MRIIGGRRAAARAAPARLYGQYPWLIVPALSLRKDQPDTPGRLAASNPFTFGPMFQASIRLGSLPLKVYRISEDRKQETPDHPGAPILRRPNPAMTKSLMVGGIVLHMLSWSRAFFVKARDPATGKPFELWPLPTLYTHPIRDPQRMIAGYEVRVPEEEVRFFPEEDVLYFRLLPDPDDWAGSSTLFGSLGDVADVGASGAKRSKQMFDSGIAERTYWHVPESELDRTSLSRIGAEIAEARRDPFAIPLIQEGELKDMGSGPNDEVMIRAMEASAKVIREALGIPEGTDDRAYYLRVVQPLADAIEQEMERRLFTDWPDDPAFPEFGYREILKGDPRERIGSHKDAIYSAQETPNEARLAENKPPLPGGDDLFVPLNLVQVGATPIEGEPRQADSEEGMGGEEGRGTVIKLPASRARLRQQGVRQFGSERRHRLSRLEGALARHLRGALRAEARPIRQLFGISRAAAMEVGRPSLEEVMGLVGRSDPELQRLLRGYMEQAGEQGAEAAAQLIAQEAIDVADRLGETYRARADAVVERFGRVRAERLEGVFRRAIEESLPTREIGAQIAGLYDESLGIHFVDGIARTEVAFANEQAAMTSWAEAGIRQMEVAFGGGPCTSGVCEEAAASSPYQLGEGVGDVGYSFEGADAPPLHPGCTCYAVPHIEEPLRQELESGG